MVQIICETQILVRPAELLFYPFFTVFILRLILFWNDLF